MPKVVRITKKSSCASEQRVTGATLTVRAGELRDELIILNDELRNIVDKQNALFAKLDDLEALVADLGPEDESFPVLIYPNAS